MPVAIKVELAKTFQTRTLLEDGIPKLYFSGTEGDYNVLVIELLGPNLEDILNYCESKLSLKTVIMIADQLIQRMESVHNRGFLHRDIKSDNFLIGTGENINRVYAIDFGLSKRYVHPHTGEHISMKKHKGLIGTARFASLNAHLGLEQSRRDDLQAVGYLIVYLAKGSLPWQKIKAKSKQQKYKKIFDVKDSFTPEALSTGLPEEFAKYLNYVKRLEFEEKPDYHFMRSLFISLLLRSGLQYDFMFDWMISKKQRQTYQRKIKKKFRTQQVKDEQSKRMNQDSCNNPNENNLKQSTQVDNNPQLMNISANEINIFSNIQIEKKFESVNVVQVRILESPRIDQKIDSILEIENPQDLTPIQLQNTVQLAQVINNMDLQIIPENNEEQISQQSRMSSLQFKNTLKMKSDVNIASQRRKQNFSPIKQRLNLRVPMDTKQLKLTKKFRSAQHFQIKKVPQMSQKLVSQISNDLSGFDELGDIDENVDDENTQIYQFLMHSSILEKEKNLTPSPVKKYRVFNAPNLFELQNMNNLTQSHHQTIHRGMQGSALVRRHGKSFDNSYQIEDENNNNEKGSSMETEYEDENEVFFEENKTRQKEHLINTSSEESVSEDSPTKNKQDIDNRNEHKQIYDDVIRQQFQDCKNVQQIKQYDSTIVVEYKKQHRDNETIKNYRKLFNNKNIEPLQSNVHEQRIDESDEDNSDYSSSVRESEVSEANIIENNLKKLEENKQCNIF